MGYIPPPPKGPPLRRYRETDTRRGGTPWIQPERFGPLDLVLAFVLGNVATMVGVWLLS